MLNRLIPMSVLTHIGNLHLPDFMDYLPVVALIKYRRQREYFIQLSSKFLITSHEVN